MALTSGVEAGRWSPTCSLPGELLSDKESRSGELGFKTIEQ